TGGTAAFSVNFGTQDGTATVADGDYVAKTGTVVFGANDTQPKIVQIAINGDTKLEANETFNVVLSGATNGATISKGTGVGVITNDDTAPVNHAPVVTAHDVSVGANTAVAASSLFVAHDQDGDATITQYAFWDGGSSGGHFTVNGVTQASGQWITVSAANLGTVGYVGGSTGGGETLFVSAFDGSPWSANAQLTATTAGHASEDFNGDGMSDILWRNDNGSVAMWQMNGTQVASNQAVGTIGTAWHVAGTDDFNGDGKAD